MKKNILLLSVLVLTIFSVKEIRAEESQAPAPDGDYNMQDAGMGQKSGGNDNRRDMMKGGMGKGMMHHQPSVVATSDGGVVILDGPRLLKYDSQLNLIGEAELKPGKKGPQMKKNDERSASQSPPAMGEPSVDLPAEEPTS